MKFKITKRGYEIKKNKLTQEQYENITKALTVSPNNFFEGAVKQKKISFPVYIETDKRLIIPKFYGKEFLNFKYKDRQPEGKQVEFKFNGKLREYQQEIVDIAIKKIREDGGGLICLGCGGGKTVLALYIACVLGLKTLIMVHKSFLLNQWKERVEEFVKCSVGIIQQNKVDTDHNIVIGMLQSIAKDKYDRDIFKDFGLVVFDEAHHAPSQFFSQALPIINCRYTLALSATPKRSDGLEKILHWYFGPTLYKADQKRDIIAKIKLIDYTIKHDKFKEYYLPNRKVNRAKTITEITKIKERNEFILEYLGKLYEEEGRNILILSDRIGHLKKLEKYMKIHYNFEYGYYIGGMKQDDLDESAKKRVILATYSMASEALDIPALNTLMMLTPRSNIEQSIGRIMRQKSSIQPLVIDFVDNIPCFKRQSYSRRRFYKKMKYLMEVDKYKENQYIESSKPSKEPKKQVKISKNTDVCLEDSEED